MNNKNILCGAIGVAAITVALGQAPAFAKDDKPWSLAVSVGAEYDSNVSVEQTDVLTREGDIAALLSVAAKYKLPVGAKSSLSVGYDFDQSLHQDLTDFDLQTHTLSVGGETEVGGFKLGADYSFFHILLGGDRFLDMHQISPSVSGFVTKSVYLRAGYTYLDKNFKVATNRDAENHQVSGDAYYFFMNNKAFVSIGARYERENTVDPILDYDSFNLSANVQLPVKVFDQDAKVKFGYAYRERDYDDVTPSIGARRHENRSTFKVAADIPLFGQLKFKPEYRYVDRNSNYALSNYTENLVTGTLSYKF